MNFFIGQKMERKYQVELLPTKMNLGQLNLQNSVGLLMVSIPVEWMEPMLMALNVLLTLNYLLLLLTMEKLIFSETHAEWDLYQEST